MQGHEYQVVGIIRHHLRSLPVTQTNVDQICWGRQNNCNPDPRVLTNRGTDEVTLLLMPTHSWIIGLTCEHDVSRLSLKVNFV